MITRKRFLQCAGLGAAMMAGGAVLPLDLNGPVSSASPAPGDVLVGALDQAINVRARVSETSKSTDPLPRLLRNGRYALPTSVLQDPEYAAAADLLSQWTHTDVAPADYDDEAAADDSSVFTFAVAGRLMRQVGRPSSLTMPNPGVFRFEVEPDDFGGSFDSASGSRRSEIIARRQDGVGLGTVWSSFCLVLGDTPGLSSAGRGIVHQWHSADEDARRTPVLFIDVANGQLSIRTCSSARVYGDEATGAQTPESGVQVLHYSTSVPSRGARTHVTLQATFGPDGHLNAWINGDQVVDKETPIGYFDDLADGSGRSVLGYPHWGLYTTNRPDSEVVYVANPEWGIGNDLSDRIKNPLPVPALR